MKCPCDMTATEHELVTGAMLRWVAEHHPGLLGQVISSRRSLLLTFVQLLTVRLSDESQVRLVALECANGRWVCYAADELHWPWPLRIE